MCLRIISIGICILTIITHDMQAQEWTPFDEKTLIERFAAENKKLGLPNATEQRVVFMGNSITEGWLQAQPQFWASHPSYINRGVSGQTTPQMLLRFRSDVINLKPKVVVILAGTNDVAGNTGVTSATTIAHNIFTMADLAKQHGIQVVICSILPVYDYIWKPGLQPVPKIKTINTLLQSYATENGHHYMDYHSVMKDDLEGLQAALTTDGVHLTSKGYGVMESLLENRIKEIIQD